MIIHKGKEYTISVRGDKAVKTGAHGTREMDYFPERDIEAVAGELDEASAWRLIHDVALQAGKMTTPISPSHILIEGDGFRLSEWSESHDPAFTAPEGYSAPWAIGATVFFAFMDCHIFQGQGGKVQKPSTPVPNLKKNLPELSETVARCLSYNPADRPTLEELAETAASNMERCRKMEQTRKSRRPGLLPGGGSLDNVWPEEMI